MRRALLLLLPPWALAVACADSDAGPPGPDTPPEEAGVPADSGIPVGDAAADVEWEGGESPCSAAGWCVTAFPDSDLEFKDIWPVSDGSGAFALAISPILGVKVLSWDKTSNAWSYIDDNTQNAPGRGKYAGGIWAPSATEIYYTVAPGTVYHGLRPTPSGSWTWTRGTLADHSPDLDPEHSPGFPHDHGNPTNAIYEGDSPSLGVWGTSGADVYAWYANTVYHRASGEAGAEEWVAEYTADDVDSDPEDPSVIEHIYFVSASGTDPDHVFFSGTRDRYPNGTACGILLQKIGGSYTRVADAVVPSAGGKGGNCQGRRGSFLIEGRDGWLTDIQARAPDRIVGLKGGRDVMRLTGTEGSYVADFHSIGQPVTIFKSGLASLWTPPEATDDQVWLSGFGLVLRGKDLWSGSELQISTISLNGVATRRPINRVRGSSSHDLWAVGVRYAFHKTTL